MSLTNQYVDIQVPVGLPLSFMGYGAVVPGGYGVSYNPTSDDIIFCICRYLLYNIKCGGSKSASNSINIYLPASIPVLKLAAEGSPQRSNNLYRSNKDIWGRGCTLENYADVWKLWDSLHQVALWQLAWVVQVERDCNVWVALNRVSCLGCVKLRELPLLAMLL